MRLWPSFQRKEATLSIDQVAARWEAAMSAGSGIVVTPETCMQSPTVQAIVSGTAKAIASLPVHVYQIGEEYGRPSRKKLTAKDHWLPALLARPNDTQTRTNFWMDATSWLLRYNNVYWYKYAGLTGPVRKLVPYVPNVVTPKPSDDGLSLDYDIRLASGALQKYPASKMVHARGAARDGYVGDSVVMDIKEAIGLEIAAEKLGAAFYGNHGMPGLVFKEAAASKGFKSEEEREKWTADFTEKISSKKGLFRSMFVPKGVDMEPPIAIDLEAMQSLETRMYQRTVIAGAFNVPPHMVGDLSKMTFGNVEQQSLDFVKAVILPIVKIFEDALERDVLTDDDRRKGLIVRFNLDAALRGDFATRQAGLATQRQNGVISANEWRENEGLNPISPADGGNKYYQQGPSGQTTKPGDDKPISDDTKPKEPANDDAKDDANAA